MSTFFLLFGLFQVVVENKKIKVKWLRDYVSYLLRMGWIGMGSLGCMFCRFHCSQQDMLRIVPLRRCRSTRPLWKFRKNSLELIINFGNESISKMKFKRKQNAPKLKRYVRYVISFMIICYSLIEDRMHFFYLNTMSTNS